VMFKTLLSLDNRPNLEPYILPKDLSLSFPDLSAQHWTSTPGFTSDKVDQGN